MALNYTSQYELATRDDVIRRVHQSIVQAAIAIAAEPATADSALDGGRLSLAAQVLRDPQKWARLFTYGVATNPTIAADTTDQDLYNIIAGMWNAYSGVKPSA